METEEQKQLLKDIEAHARGIIDAIRAGNGGEAVFFAGEILRECEQLRKTISGDESA